MEYSVRNYCCGKTADGFEVFANPNKESIVIKKEGNHGGVYLIIQANYCPWCGKKITE